MGLIFRQLEMLAAAKRRGVPMKIVLTIGRQSLFLHPPELRILQKRFGIALPNYRWGEFADRFLTDCLGIEQLDVMDYSSYEGANILHDLSRPVPGDLKSKYDIVIEAGTLEHIFNFPVAIANLMSLVKVGGMLNVSAVANNLCGHGFYQFSPELIFRVFTPENGFALRKLFAIEARYPGIELSPMHTLYEVVDPAAVGCRVGLMTCGPVLLLFDAIRTDEKPLFAAPPLQSDYVAAWESNSAPAASTTAANHLTIYMRLRRMLGKAAWAQTLHRRRLGMQQRKEFSLRNRRFFRKIDGPAPLAD
jgi:hypothetical protein